MISKHVNYRFYRIAVLALAMILFIPASSIAVDVILEWDKNIEEPDIAGYIVYYGYSSRHDVGSVNYGNYEFKIDEVGNQTTYTISDLNSGQLYYFAVTAYYIGGHQSEFSKEIIYYVSQSTIDSDGDGLTDEGEINFFGTDHNNADTDGDSITDGNEIEYWGYNWDKDHDGDSIINLLDPDSDNDGLLDGLELLYEFNPSDANSRPLFPIMQTGEVSINHKWQRIEFTKPFFDPVVVAKSLSYNGTDPAILRIQNVDITGFDICIQEWEYLKGNHKDETVGYIIMERSSYTLADGTMVEAGSFTTDNTTSFDEIVNFKSKFNYTPVVTTAVVSYSGSDAVFCRTVSNDKIDGFAFCLQEQELNSKIHATEEVAYIAWEPSSGIVNSVAFEINIKFNINDDWQEISFNQGFENAPVFISDMQTNNGPDPANVRWENKDTEGVDVKISEEQSYDHETDHASETVGFMAFSVQ
ncbi:MAG: fibronectin type III domain-containing protein [Desulfobacteraceae bacterium]|nr:fibronectin type III domain-containing protein [Desulfobacteraceae bacterium]MBC2720223.1 fibronectin type III domain-containing protein [Desulfobacteraceae bacterium]